MRLRGSQIQSFMPSLDARAVDGTRVLEGKNYYFDSKGPKSGFSTKILSPFSFGARNGVEGKRLEGATFVFTNQAVLTWESKRPSGWRVVYSWDSILGPNDRTPWSAVFMEDEYILTHEQRGFYRVVKNDTTGVMYCTQETMDDIPGLIQNIVGATVVRNRLILVNDGAVQWSGVGNSHDMTPGIAGAGFQLLSSFVQGEPIEIMGFKDGFIVWTTGGAVLAEFISGNQTWRWTPFSAEERPISRRSTIQLMNGAHVFLSQRGLKVTANAQVPSDFTPEFNEFLREYLKDSNIDLSKWALAYDPARELIFVSESLDGVTYWRTFVLAPTIDKWGEFSDRVHQFLPLDKTKFGYVDTNGIANYFFDNMTREINPPNSWGLNLLYPRKQKEFGESSTTASLFVAGEDIAELESRYAIDYAGWYNPDSPNLHVYANGSLDSEIHLGYFRPAEMQESADGFIEIQEVVVGTHPSLPTYLPDFTVLGREDNFYFESEDWNDGSGPPVEDWNLDSESEDWNHPAMNYLEFKMEFVIQASDDGHSYMIEVTPELARFDLEAKTYSCFTSGNLHRFIFRAMEPGAYFHLTYLEMTGTYGGQMI